MVFLSKIPDRKYLKKQHFLSIIPPFILSLSKDPPRWSLSRIVWCGAIFCVRDFCPASPTFNKILKFDKMTTKD